MLSFKDLVAHVAAQPTPTASTRTFVQGVQDAVAAIRSKADVQIVLVDLANNADHLAGALSFGTALQHQGQVRPVGVDAPVVRVIEQTPPAQISGPLTDEQLAEIKTVPIEIHRDALAEIRRLGGIIAALQEQLLNPQIDQQEQEQPHREQPNGPIDDPSAAGQSQPAVTSATTETKPPEPAATQSTAPAGA